MGRAAPGRQLRRHARVVTATNPQAAVSVPPTILVVAVRVSIGCIPTSVMHARMGASTAARGGGRPAHADHRPARRLGRPRLDRTRLPPSHHGGRCQQHRAAQDPHGGAMPW
jgi:hypothetical protein